MRLIFESLMFIFASLSLFSDIFGDLAFRYHNNEELEHELKKFLDNGIKQKLRTRLYQIGNSSSLDEPFPLWVLELTAASENSIGVPNVKLLGNLHGNEAGGREILLHFIEHLITYYGSDQNVTWLLNNTRIHILPTINPDGFRNAGNSCEGVVGRTVPIGNVDLNRDFPDTFHPNPHLKFAKESIAVMKWMEDTKFILSAALHEGAMVANYPYDAISPDGLNEFLTPDDDVFKHLARTYSFNHPIMRTHKGCPSTDKKFPEGITNGAAWYQFDRGMGDYNYYHGCMEVTLEVSCCKYPSNLSNLWNENKQSLLLYCMQANRGVTGRVLDFETKQPVEEAMLKIIGRSKFFKTFKGTGEFWRILLPGVYELEVRADGYYSRYEKFRVDDFKDFPKLTNLTIYLTNASVSTTTSTTSTEKTTTTATTHTVESTSKVINFTNRFAEDDPNDDNNNEGNNTPSLSELKGGSNRHFSIFISVLTSLVIILC